MASLSKTEFGFKLILMGIISLLTAFAYSQIDHKQLRIKCGMVVLIVNPRLLIPIGTE